MAEKKKDIFVVMSGSQPLHAVCTERQAKRFVESYGHPTEDCRLFLGMLHYKRVKLIPPRTLSDKQKNGLRKSLQAKSLFGESGPNNEKDDR